MAGSNDFLTFAGGGGANVLTQAQYAALTSLLANGFSSGTAAANQLNKVWRQSSIMSAVMGALVADVTGQNVVDDGTTATILSNLMATLLKAAYVDDTGVVNAYVLTFSPAPLAYYDGMKIRFSTLNANTTTNPTVNVNSLGAVTITLPGGGALVAGQIPANVPRDLVYNSSGPRFELQDSLSESFADLRYQLSGADQSGGNKIVVTGNLQLTTAHSGKFLDVWAAPAGTAITFPNGALFPSGFNITIGPNQNSLSIINSVTGANVVDPTGNALALNSGGSWNKPVGLGCIATLHEFATGSVCVAFISGRTIVSDAVNNNEAVALGQFLAGQAKTANGSQSLPGGIILKFGTSASIAANTSGSVVFSTAFPNALLTLVIAPNALANVAQGQDGIVSSSVTGFTASNQDNVAHSLNWFAIGY